MSNLTIKILEMGFGILFMIGAGFNSAYTLKHGEEFYRGFAKGAWFSPASWFINRFVIPNPRIFTIWLILFQLFVAIALLSQGPNVRLGLLAGTAFCLYAVFVSNFSGAIANLAMAVLLYYLASIK